MSDEVSLMMASTNFFSTIPWYGPGGREMTSLTSESRSTGVMNNVALIASASFGKLAHCSKKSVLMLTTRNRLGCALAQKATINSSNNLLSLCAEI